MQRKISRSTSLPNNLFTFTQPQNRDPEIEIEKQKILHYMTARRYLIDARDKIDMKASNGIYILHSFISAVFLHFDQALLQLPVEGFHAFLNEKILETKSMYNLAHPSLTRSPIEKLFLVMVDKNNADSKEFKTKILNTIYEIPDEKSKFEMGDISVNFNLDNMEEFFNTLIKCGATKTFHRVMNKIDRENRDKIIEKHGDQMIRLALKFKHIQLVKDLVNYGCDINNLSEGVVRLPNHDLNHYCYDGSLGYVIDLMITDLIIDDTARKEKHEEYANFFKTSHVMSEYQLPPYQSGASEKNTRFYQEALEYLLSAGADPDARGFSDDFVGTPVRLRKADVIQALPKLPTLREHCSTFKKKIEESELREDIKNKLINMLDIVINAPAIQHHATPTRKM